MAAPQASSRLEMLQARFQQRQLLEKEQKLLQLYDQQQLRAHQVAQRGSAGSNGSNSSGHGTSGTATHRQTVTRTSTSTQSTSNSQGGGKVRQMFDERRQTTVKGIDKSHPLEPLDNRSRKQQTTTSTTSNVSTSSTSPQKNGNPMSNRQSVVTKRTVRTEANSNINGGRPIVSYHEEVSRESCGPSGLPDEEEEFGNENDLTSRYSNGNRHIDQRDEVQIDDVTNDNANLRHRTTAKIHLAAFDINNGTNRVDDALDNEQYSDNVADVPDRLPRRTPAAKKPTQAEARLERFKNSNTKKPANANKQVAGNTPSFTKKRTETTNHSGSATRESTTTRTTEEATSRGSSTSPELVRAARTRSSSPEVAVVEKKFTSPVVERQSSGVKSSCISKVSQLTHKNSMDFYPRRKSEFEKSKTFRKLQLELGESSPEPAEPDEVSEPRAKECRKRSYVVESNIYSSSRRSSSSSPIGYRGGSPGRRNSRGQTPESRRGSESPINREKSTATRVESKKFDSTTKTTNSESNIYSCRRRSSSSNPITDFSKERRNSREKTPEISRRGSESPSHGRKSSITNEDIERTNVEASTYSWRRRIDRDVPSGRRDSAEKSVEPPHCRRESEKPFNERKVSTSNDDMKKKSTVRASTYSSRRRSSSESPSDNRDLSDERRHSREESPDLPQSRRGSENKFDEKKSTSMKEGTKRSSTDSATYTSRRRSSSASPLGERDASKLRRTSHDSSPERPSSRRGSDSPNHRVRSTVTSAETTTTRGGCKITSKQTTVTREETSSRSESPVSRRVTRKRSESPRGKLHRTSAEPDDSRLATDSRRKSGGTLRSVELVKKFVRPVSSEISTTAATRSSVERETNLEDVEFPVHTSKSKDTEKKPKSPVHKVVKKDRAVMEPSNEEQKSKNTSRKNSNPKTGRAVASRSRTVSPSPPRTMKETASSRAKKIERRMSVESKKNHLSNPREEKKIDERNKINVSKESSKSSMKFEAMPQSRSPSPPVDRPQGLSRRSSSETTVRRHDTFKVSRPTQKTIEIESSVDTDEESSDTRMRNDRQNKSQLFERIEKIRTTLSRSGRSEQNLPSRDFERTDSVESALRRFDSIGVETEHQITVGVDETDVYPVCAPANEKSSIEKKTITKKSAVQAHNEPEKIIVAVIKVPPRKIDAKARVPTKEKFSRTKIVNVENEKSVTTPRPVENKMTPKSRLSQTTAKSLVRKSKLRGDEPSGRGDSKGSDRSPLCKRKLFDDSESEIETDNSRSTVVLSSIMGATKSGENRETEELKNRDNLEGISTDDMMRSESYIVECKTELDQPTKVLRSIEDIRKSIERESQDFKRELNKFNTAMRRDEEDKATSEYPDTTVTTSGLISRVRITKTIKSGADAPVIKIERSTVKLPITHRVTKSPSPDIGTKRFIDGRARTPTSSVRRSVPSSPAKSPDATIRYVTSASKTQGSRSSARPSTSPSSVREQRNRSASSRTSEYSDCTDGPGNNFQSAITETVSILTKKNDELFDDDELSRARNVASSKSPLRKKSSERSLTSQKQQKSAGGTQLSRPASALSTASSGGSARGQVSNSKSGMSTKAKAPNAPKGPPASTRDSNAAAVNDGLAPCKICGRRFNSDRITLHEQICSKTATKKRKTFDATTHRVKGTELEPFVLKKGPAKKSQADRKGQKPEVKSNWRRKHEDFINAIRSAKQVQAHLAAGGKLSDLPPPPASDTSDYVQCPHCGRKFNQGAAERHIPKCQNMLHNKPNPRAPPKPKR